MVVPRSREWSSRCPGAGRRGGRPPRRGTPRRSPPPPGVPGRPRPPTTPRWSPRPPGPSTTLRGGRGSDGGGARLPKAPPAGAARGSERCIRGRTREEARSRRRLRDGGEEQGVRLLLAASPDDRGARDGPEDVADDPGPPGYRVSPEVGVAPRERQEKKSCAALLDEAPGEAGRVGPPAAEGAGQRRGKFLVPGADLDSDRDGVREVALRPPGQGGLPPYGDGLPSFARGQGDLHDPPRKGLLREDDRHTSGFRERAGCPTFFM